MLLKANGRTLRTYLDWEAVKLDLKVGDTIGVSVKSGLLTGDHRIVAGDLPTVTAARVRVLQGMELVTVTPSVRAERNIQVDAGALVLSINDTIAAQTGIQRYDVIYGMNQQPLRSADEVARQLNAVRAGQSFYLFVERAGQHFTIPLRMNQ